MAYDHITKKRQMTKQAAESSKFTKNEGRPPEDGHGIGTETCRVFVIDAFYRTF
jgi:hypothetical protein